ncbi:MAG: FAD-dependent oxidoreductase [Planctomycetaceae bacterium]|jgi:thioredoxin reductase (NADPH)|nr:FAD-dependent oxidoreductase [Planctomycetaceae bacterium]
MEKIIIIGSGPAAWTAAIYAARGSLSPLVVEGQYTDVNQARGTLPMGQLTQTTEVENFPGFPSGNVRNYVESAIPSDRVSILPPRDPEQNTILGAELVELIRAQATFFGTRVVTDEIVAVDFTGNTHKLTGAEGNIYEAQAVIIATGASAKYLGLKSEQLYKNRGVSACAVCDGALPRYRNNEVAVIGGGDAALEEAIYLAKFASKVHLIHRRDQFRASQILINRLAEFPQIKVHFNYAPTEIIGTKEIGVTGIKLSGTNGNSDLELSLAGVFVAIGHEPNTGFLRGSLALNADGTIILPIPFRTNTSIRGVFAAGDVVDGRYRQAVIAAATGCMAALDAEKYLIGSDGF